MRKSKNHSDDYTAVLLEQMRDEIKGVAEGVTNLNEKMDRKFGEVGKRFDAVDRRFDGMEGRLGGVEGKLDKIDGRVVALEERFDNFEREMKSGFKSVMAYLSRIEDEIVDINVQLKQIEKNQAADRKEIVGLKARVDQVEEALKRHKISLGRTAHGGIHRPTRNLHR